MILHKNWGEIARLGNYLFKYASLLGFSKRYDTDLYLPENYMFDYFVEKPKLDANFIPNISLTERRHCFDIEFWDHYKDDFKTKNVNITLSTFLQSSKYWRDYEDFVIDKLKFKSEEIEKVKEKYKDALLKKTIGISIRRGDFVRHPYYYQIPNEFYIYSLNKYFPDYKDYNIIMFCDDQKYIRDTWKGESIFYADGNFIDADSRNNPMEQLILGSLCDNFIISNSTFSWWLGYLAVNAKKTDGKVIHSGENFNMDNPFITTINASSNDFYDDRWIKSDFIK